MLERLILADFQGWERFTLDLERITVLVGPSDVGKSSILRALRWLALNWAPRRGRIIRNGAERVLAKLKVDGHYITRRKGEGGNVYLLDGEKRSAVGTEVPPEILDLLNIHEINFQGQHDLPYWFSETAPSVSRNLNAIVNLGAIDESLSAVATTVRNARSRKELTLQRLEQAKETEQKLLWVSSFTKRVDSLYALKQEVQKGTERVEQLRSALQEVDRLREEANAVIPDTTRLQSLYEDSEGLRVRVRKVKSACQAMRAFETEIRETSSEIKRLESEAAELFTRGCPICHQKLPKSFKIAERCSHA